MEEKGEETKDFEGCEGDETTCRLWGGGTGLKYEKYAPMIHSIEL